MIGSMYDFTAGRAKRPLLKDPRRRFLLFLLLVVIVIQLSSLVALITVLLVNLCLVRISGLPWKYVGWRLLLIVPFGLGAVVLLPFSIPGEPLWTLWRFVLSEEGMSKGLLILFKLINANLLVTLLLASTPLDVLLRTLKQVKIPPVMVELMGFMLRYLSVLTEEAQKMLVSQKARGLKMNGFLPWRTYKRIGQLLGVLFIRSFRRSERIHAAMLSRGMDWLKEGARVESCRDRKPDVSVPKRYPSVERRHVVR